MSDLFETRQKAEEGINWRGSITVPVDGEQKELTVRQLRDPEFWEVMTLIDLDEIEELQGDLPEDDMEEYRELADKDELDDQQQNRLASLEEQLNDEINIFDAISLQTYNGIVKAAKYCVEPDNADVQQALGMHAAEIEEQYGAATQEAAEKYVNKNVVKPMIDDFTDLTSFAIGMKSLEKTLEDEGN
mgnify:CR=1 FL=1